MAINLKNAEAERLLNALAEQTGETLTEAAAVAFRERLEHLAQQRAAQQKRALSSLLDLIAEARAAPTVDRRPLKELTDELWGD